MQDDLKELITIEQANQLFAVLAIALPVICTAAGAAMDKRQKANGRLLKSGVLLGMPGPAIWVLWQVYNRITDKLGLDTVKNLMVNLGLFVFLGIVGGLIASRVLLNGKSAEESTTEVQAKS